jgi:hypothetical protein
MSFAKQAIILILDFGLRIENAWRRAWKGLSKGLESFGLTNED